MTTSPQFVGLRALGSLYHGVRRWSTVVARVRERTGSRVADASIMMPAMPPRRPPHDDDSSDSLPGTIDGLNPDDPGVRLLGRELATIDPQELLLVHCGDLASVRPGATRLILDVRERLGSRHSCVADVAAKSPISASSFSQAALWPRAHLGKDFSERCLAIATLAVHEGGRVLCAVRKQKGGKSLGRTMKALLGEGNVEVIERERGYHLWVGHRGADCDLALVEELLDRSYAFELAIGLAEPLALIGRPGVFSRRGVDGGTQALLEVLAAVADADMRAQLPAPTRVIDLCAGIGPLALTAARRWPTAQVVAVESNLRASALIRENAERNQLGDRVQVIEHDGLPSGLAKADLALLNPPTHADPHTLTRLLDLRASLNPGGRLLVVVNRAHPTVDILQQQLGAEVRGGERDGYFVLEARW
jgi:16S rRNA G1207 methylase RsmC